jgi:xanthine dehydrogenase molybdopterin-binding subunit B
MFKRSIVPVEIGLQSYRLVEDNLVATVVVVAVVVVRMGIGFGGSGSGGDRMSCAAESIIT